MTWVLWNPVSDRLEIVLVLMQDRCTVCVKRTIGSEIILDAPDETPDGCTIGTDIIFNAPMVLLGDEDPSGSSF